jgi:UDP-3-O-[3-hydroxymyristoyl] glucosamine N-acyltransferase
MGFTLAELARLVQGTVRGDAGLVVERANSLERAGAHDISFVADKRHLAGLSDCAAGAVIMTADSAASFSGNALIVANPPLAFARISAQLHPVAPSPPGIHASAAVDASARIAPDASVGPHSVIGAGAEIGAGAAIGPGCVIGRGVRIGAQSRLVARVVVLDDCIIGRRCLLHPGAVIGADGFGFARDGARWVRQPQLGRVVVGDDVEVGANTTVDRGTFDDTVLADGVKLDNLVHIAHNVRLGADTAIAALVGIAGSTIVGARCTIAGQAGIIDHVEIADDVHIAAASPVTNSLKHAGVYAATLKAEPAMQWRRTMVRLGQLEELTRRLRHLEEQLQSLRKE